MGATATLTSPNSLARILSSTVNKLSSPATGSASKGRVKSHSTAAARDESALKNKQKGMESSGSGGPGGSKRSNRVPLKEVVSDCERRWFEDTLKEAKAGDRAMQVLVGQMYNSGYGVAKDAHKGRAWINKASRLRSSVWKVGEKRPGYNASDSDSEDTKVDAT